MPQRLIGLVGRGKGPRVFVPNGEATAEIRGFFTGQLKLVTNETEHKLDSHSEGLVVCELGGSSEWVEFEYEGDCRVICSVKVA